MLCYTIITMTISMTNLRDLERLLKPLANKRRLFALSIIKERKEANVSEIATELRLSIQATSRHLLQLYRADIIQPEQRSLSVYYTLVKNQHPSIRALINSL